MFQFPTDAAPVSLGTIPTINKHQFALFPLVRRLRVFNAGEPSRGSSQFSTIARKSQNLSDARSQTCAVDCIFISGVLVMTSRKMHVEIPIDFEQ